MGSTAKIAFSLETAFLVVALTLLIVTILLITKTARFIRSARQTKGAVLDNVPRQDGEGGTIFCPRFTFTTDDRREFVVASKTGTSPPAFRDGEQIEVLYNPLKPEDARIKTFAQLWLAPTICGPLGVVFLLVGLYFWYLQS